MSAPPGQILAAGALPVTLGAPRVVGQSDREHFERVSRFAAFWARPVAFVDPSYLSIGPLGAEAVVAMDANPYFRGPVNASVSEALGLTKRPLDSDLVALITESPSHQLVIPLMTAPIASLQRVGLALAAAILSGRVSGLILKSDRAQARAALGDAGFQIAVEEAPFMYGALAEIDLKAPGTGLMPNDGTSGSSAIEILRFARASLGRLCDALVPALTELLALRFPVDPAFDDRARMLGPFSPKQIDLAVRMIKRKEPSWLASIG